MKKRLLAIPVALALSGVIGLAVFLGGTDPEGLPNPVSGISFPYTDDNTGETLHIYANDTSYTNGLSHAEVYLAVVNNSGKKQDVELLAYFEDTNKRIESVSILTEQTRTRDIPITGEMCEKITSTTTGKKEDVCIEEQTGVNVEQYKVLAWEPVSVVNRTSAEKTKENSRVLMNRKADSAYISTRKSQGVVQDVGEVVYYKVVIQFEPNNSGNFFFEAIGSQGGYGHLK
jgi:hypothetical protein